MSDVVAGAVAQRVLLVDDHPIVRQGLRRLIGNEPGLVVCAEAETLREAQQHPAEHRDLIVRVAGYSDYFCDLSDELQEEIITRTEHESM